MLIQQQNHTERWTRPVPGSGHELRFGSTSQHENQKVLFSVMCPLPHTVVMQERGGGGFSWFPKPGISSSKKPWAARAREPGPRGRGGRTPALSLLRACTGRPGECDRILARGDITGSWDLSLAPNCAIYLWCGLSHVVIMKITETSPSP